MEQKLVLVNALNAEVGEGPVWDVKNNKFLFLDIRGKYIVIKDDKKEEQIMLPQQIGCFALCENADLLVALEDAVYRTKDGKTFIKAHQKIKIKGRRFNDGKVGPDGAFYLGTTDVDGQGAFYRLKDGILTELFDGCACSNGIDWTSDGKTMFYIDSPKQMIEAFDFDVKTGVLSGRRKVVDIPKEWGIPDGMTLDCNDDMFVALWDGYKVVHIDKDTLKVKEEFILPCPKASCCAFGGKEMNELYITTARMEDMEKYPQAGNTFKIKTKTKGKPINYYKY